MCEGYIIRPLELNENLVKGKAFLVIYATIYTL